MTQGSNNEQRKVSLLKDETCMSFLELKVTFGLEKQDFFIYLQIWDYFIKDVKTGPDIDLSSIIKIIEDAYQRGRTRVISDFYQASRESRGNSTLYMKKNKTNGNQN